MIVKNLTLLFKKYCINSCCINIYFKTFSNNLTKEGYEIIINEFLAPFIANYPLDGVKLIQDNDRKHTSGLCEAAIANNNIDWVKILVILQ